MRTGRIRIRKYEKVIVLFNIFLSVSLLYADKSDFIGHTFTWWVGRYDKIGTISFSEKRVVYDDGDDIWSSKIAFFFDELFIDTDGYVTFWKKENDKYYILPWGSI
jgi:hypothetical protein